MPKVSGFSLKKYFPYYVYTVFFVKVFRSHYVYTGFSLKVSHPNTYIRLFFLICCRKNKKSSDTFLKKPECTSRGKIIPTLFGKTRYVRSGKKILPTLSRIVGNIRYGTIFSETLWRKKLYVPGGGKIFQFSLQHFWKFIRMYIVRGKNILQWDKTRKVVVYTL